MRLSRAVINFSVCVFLYLHHQPLIQCLMSPVLFSLVPLTACQWIILQLEVCFCSNVYLRSKLIYLKYLCFDMHEFDDFPSFSSFKGLHWFDDVSEETWCQPFAWLSCALGAGQLLTHFIIFIFLCAHQMHVNLPAEWVTYLFKKKIIFLFRLQSSSRSSLPCARWHISLFQVYRLAASGGSLT